MPLPPLASEDDLAIMLGVPATDGKLQLALRRASSRFRGRVKRPITKVIDDTIWLNGDGTNALLLPSAPVVGTPTVLVDGSPVTNFEIDREQGILRSASCWPDHLGNIEVTYTHGFEEVPGDIQDAVLEQAELQYRVIAGVSQMSLGGQSFTFGSQASVGVSQRWSDAVAVYRLYRGDRN